MKKLLASTALMTIFFSYNASGSLFYECVSEEKSVLIFSEGSDLGQPHIIYSNAGRDNFYLVGGKIKIRKESNQIIVNGQLSDHVRLARFAAVFPYTEAQMQSGEASLTFIDRYSMPLINPPFNCTIKSVQK